VAFDIPEWYFSLSMALFGLLFGSFANVVSWRLPRGESLVRPGSHCPRCDAPIAWYDNIPVLSWLVLRGRCRQCSEPISARYPLVEAASGALFLLAALVWGPVRARSSARRSSGSCSRSRSSTSSTCGSPTRS